jgi:3'(2'), 5'-bisphosphate nucleotidase
LLDPTGLSGELALAISLARQAGHIVMAVRAGDLGIEYKAGDEPVTIADKRSSDLISAALAAAYPDDIVISEENPDDRRRRTAARVWFIDPIDGTRDYIAGRDGFSVMIGLLIDGLPALGVVFQASKECLYFATVDSGAFVQHATDAAPRAIRVSTVAQAGNARLVASQSHRTNDTDALKQTLGISDEQNIGSVGLKLCLIATGTRDLYVNPTPKAKLWDTCAPSAIIMAAGGALTDLQGQPLDYRSHSVAHHRGIVGSNTHIHAEVLVKLQPLFASIRSNSSHLD